jgi:biofilm PGA synthesis N-glycosyltransferase PgaC
MLVFSIIVLAINLAYWVFLFSRLTFYRTPGYSKAPSRANESAEMIVCARNEAENIRTHLPYWLDQDTSSYGLTLIDDHSTDETKNILQEIQKDHPRLKVIHNASHLGKKRSLHRSIPLLEGDILIFTDADCQPGSKRWLDLMLSSFHKEVDLVLAYAPFHKEKTAINLFARFECVMTAIQYLSYALAGIPYMGVGRNLAYRKKIFEKVRGFSSHLEILSGDDDLFINEVATKENTAIQLDPDSFVYSAAPTGWGAFIRQKRRHISTSPKYRWKHKLLLTFFAMSHILFYFSLLFLGLETSVLLFLVRMLILLPLVYSILGKLKEKDLFWYFPLLDILLAIYYVVMAISPIFPNRNKW